MAKVILDISHHEKVKDWKALKENVSVLIFKATEGTSFTDPNCYDTIQKCESHGIPYWLYAFLKKGNELAQAKYLVDKTKGEVGKYFVGYCIDAERGNMASKVKEALDYVKVYSRKTMLYTAHEYYYLYKDLVKVRGSECAWWEPRYSKILKPHEGVDLWQYSENYVCPYISGKVDINKIYGNKPLSWFTTPAVTVKKTTTTSPIQTIIKVAEGEVGYLEKKSNSSLDSKTANAGKSNYTKYGKWIGANGDYWCASFLSWLFYKAFGLTIGKKLLCGSYSAACETIRQNFIKKGQYHKTNPKAGDVIFFSGTRHSGANHIGLIYKVADGKVYTIEGNTSGASGVIDNGGGVAKKSYSTSNSRILGYGRPDYSIVSGKTNTVPKTNVVYYPKYTGKSISLVDALKAVGVKDTSISARKKIAAKNGISNYIGSATQNTSLLRKLKNGSLIKP